MIHTFTISLSSCFGYEPDPAWKGTLEIDGSATLEQLHEAIQEAINFENDHLYAFYTAPSENSTDRNWFDHQNGGIYKPSVESLFPLPKNRKFFYLFDFGDSWVFRIGKSRKKPHEPLEAVEYPRLVDETGKMPDQYPSLDDDFLVGDDLSDEDLSQYDQAFFDQVREVYSLPVMKKHSFDFYENCGFLLAAVSSPRFYTPTQWLPALFSDGKFPKFKTVSDAGDVTDRLTNLWNHWAASIDTGLMLPPACVLDEKTAEANAELKSFCRGYIEGMHWTQDDWDTIFDLLQESSDNDIYDSVSNIYATGIGMCSRLFLGADEFARIDPEADKDGLIWDAKYVVDLLPEMLEKIGSLGREFSDALMAAEEPPEPVISHEAFHATPTVGRNEPCPCGSGKKFKKCCLH